MAISTVARWFLTSLIGVAAFSPLAVQAQIASPPPHLSDPALRLRINGAPEMVFAADAHHCPSVDEGGLPSDVPDAPLRAVQTGPVATVFLGNPNNYLFHTRNLGTLVRDSCASAMMSQHNPNPMAFADHQWIVAGYKLPDNSIFGLVHDEFWGAAHLPACKERLPHGAPVWAPTCLYISQTGAISTDNGKSFHLLPRPAIASIPRKFGTDIGRGGIEDPSNIVLNPKDGYLYFAATARLQPGPGRWTCMFRTKDPIHQPWFTWDGSGFRQQAGSAYDAKVPQSWCMPVNDYALSSLVYNKAAGVFIGLGIEKRQGGLFYQTSPDLVHWSRPMTLKETAFSDGWHPGLPDPVSYPSLLDPQAGGVNFDQWGKCGYVYYVSWRTTGGRPNARQRDVFRQAVCS